MSPDHSTQCGSHTAYDRSRCVVCHHRCRLLNTNHNTDNQRHFTLSGLVGIWHWGIFSVNWNIVPQKYPFVIWILLNRLISVTAWTGRWQRSLQIRCQEQRPPRKGSLMLSIDDCQRDLSNSEKDIDKIVATCSDISTLWSDSDCETKQKIQVLVFPNGILWDSQNSIYRTPSRNAFFDIINRFSAGYGIE